MRAGANQTGDFSQRFAVPPQRLQSDEVVPVKFVGGGLGQVGAGDSEVAAAQLCGGVAVVDSGDFRQRFSGGLRAETIQRGGSPFAAVAGKPPALVVRERRRVAGVQGQAKPAADAVRRANPRQNNGVLRVGGWVMRRNRRAPPRVFPPQPPRSPSPPPFRARGPVRAATRTSPLRGWFWSGGEGSG